VPPHITFEGFAHPDYNARVVMKENGRFGNVLTEMPLSVLCLSSYVKKHARVETRLIDFNVELNEAESFRHDSFPEYFRGFLLQKEYKEYNPTIVGISCLFTPAYQNMIQIANVCKEAFPRALVVAGGGVPTNMYRQIFTDSRSFDALCFGEGEKPLLALVVAEDKPAYLEGAASWITPKKAHGEAVLQHDFVHDLDDVPFYDYDICKVKQYGNNPALTAYASIKEQTNNFHVMTSRGCTHHCCFCSSHSVHGRVMRYYSLERVRKDFTRLKEKYGAEIFVFQDDHLMADRKRVLEILETVKQLGVRAVFQNGLSLYALDREILESMKAVGVDQLMLSIESGSERVLRDVMHKPLNLNIVRRVAKDCRELGIYTNANILIGLPGETKRDIEDAREFLRTVNANWYLIFCASPLVGSEMYDICKKKNYLRADFVGSDYKKAVVETEEFSAEYIQEMSYELNIQLNFFENSDFRLGEYKTALVGFENAIRAKDDHAPAYYMAAQCYGKIGAEDKAREYMERAKKIVTESTFWKKYFDKFNIRIKEIQKT
jgi:radical SAM superfamily enzyme YgiQ (UPF0313 family)